MQEFSTYAAWQSFLDALDLTGQMAAALHGEADGTFMASVSVHTLHLTLRVRIDLERQQIGLADTTLELRPAGRSLHVAQSVTFPVLEPNGLTTADVIAHDDRPFVPVQIRAR